mgnify:CR=1 FL=1
MKDIFIDLENGAHSRTIDLTLTAIVSRLDSTWHDKVTCITQEADSTLFYWSAPVEEVIEARQKADLAAGLMPIVGWNNLVRDDFFEIDDVEFVAKDWTTAVVTQAMFLAHIAV